MRATHIGMLAEAILRAFWLLVTVIFVVVAPLMFGWQDWLPLEAFWTYVVVSGLALLTTLLWGLRGFKLPTRAQALARVDAAMPGRPIAAMADAQAIGRGDPASEAVWRAHIARMEARSRDAKPVEPDLRIADRDPYGLRFMALLFFVTALLFGSIWRVGTVGVAMSGTQNLATGPVWEGWIEPPAYTGQPTLYLADQTGETIEAPQGSRITLRLYG
ncbi:MAG: DUF4175 family protein, partial [Yoonia sp.]|nr:DUF4175 family protein [Yoonia sp.]